MSILRLSPLRRNASLAPLFAGGAAGSPLGFAPLMQTLGRIVIIALPLSALLMVRFVLEPRAVAHGMISWKQGIKIAARNGPFMRLLAAVIWFFEKGPALGEGAGLPLAYWGMAQKGADAIGVGLGLSIHSFFAFDPNGANDDTALFGLKVVYILVPMLFWLLSAVFIWGFPLTPERQRRTRLVLERRAARELARA